MADKRVGISLAVFFAALLVLHFGFEIKPKPYMLLLGYTAVFMVASLFFKVDKEKAAENEKYKDWPTSGPIGRYGQKGLILLFYGTGILCFLNPFQLVQIIRQGIGNVWLKMQKDKMINDASAFETRTNYSLPFDKNREWLVYNGGSKKVNSHSWDVITQRYAYDFVIANEKYERHSNKGTKPEDYFCYDANILSVAEGEVIKICDGKNDAPFIGYGVIDFLTTNFIGNHIVIKHAENEYSFYAHLKKGTIKAVVGDKVSQGQVIARCGHSGYSTEPHLHFHLQDKANFFFARGLPVQFTGLKINGHTISRKSFIEAGDRVVCV